MPEKHEHESLIKCPYCGFEDEDSWGVDENTDGYACGGCGETFSVQVHATVAYTTAPTPCDARDEAETHDYEQVRYVESTQRYDRSELIPREESLYFEVSKCTKCCDTEYRNMSKEEYEIATAKPASP